MKNRIKLIVYHTNEDDPKKCSARKLQKFGFAKLETNLKKIPKGAIILSPFQEKSISREDFVSESIPLTIIVEMAEIFPGFPTFYFILIVGGVAAVVGSSVTYRLIQVSRSPTSSKKARAMKKRIKGKKTISESLLYPTKEEYIVKQLGNKWEMLGLSLKDILGVKEKKAKTLPEIKEEFKGGVD